MPISSELINLQWKQLQHDQNYHRDIWLLTVHHRVNHMVLHFAKYSGQLVQASFEKDMKLFSRSCIDTLVIATSLANILNVNLSEEFSEHSELESIDDLSKQLSLNSQLSIDVVAREVPIVVGKLAKAAESIDHLEQFDFREVLSSLVLDVFKLALSGCSFINNEQSILSRIENRILSVEKKSIFFQKLGNYREGY